MPEAVKFHYYYDGAVSDELCDRIVDTFDVDVEGQMRGELDGKVRYSDMKISTDIRITSRLSTPTGKRLWQEIDDALYEVVSATWLRYQSDVPSTKMIHPHRGIEDTGYQIQKYAQGEGQFLPHIDSGSGSTATRCAACVIYLNTVEEGGGTRFTYWNDTVDPVKGRVLWFPAGFTHVHEGLTPVTGPKYIISTFIKYKDEPTEL